jgi:putative transposase
MDSSGNPPRKKQHLAVEFSRNRRRKFYMKTSRFSDSQILAILKQAEAGTPVPETCREHGIRSATFYKYDYELTTG